MKHLAKKEKTGFTLIELLVVIAIVGILAGVIVVGTVQYRQTARATKALAQLSSVIPSMVSCWGNGTTGTEVNPPDISGTSDDPPGGNPICSLGDSYGKWPESAGDLEGYTYNVGSWTKSQWRLYFRSGNDKKQICCNSAMMNCKIQDYSGGWPTCAWNDPTN